MISIDLSHGDAGTQPQRAQGNAEEKRRGPPKGLVMAVTCERDSHHSGRGSYILIVAAVLT